MYNMDELSVCLQKLPIRCCRSDMVVNANDIVLLAPSAKEMQNIIEATYAYLIMVMLMILFLT